MAKRGRPAKSGLKRDMGEKGKIVLESIVIGAVLTLLAGYIVCIPELPEVIVSLQNIGFFKVIFYLFPLMFIITVIVLIANYILKDK